VALLAESAQGATKSNKKSAAKAGVAKGSPAAGIRLVKMPGLRRAIESRKGNVVVVGVWASWCGPCRKEFPDLVGLHREYAGNDVVCMSVSIDNSSNRAAVRRFLTRQKAFFANYLLHSPEALDDPWAIETIPAVLVFGRDGRLVKKFENAGDRPAFTFKEIRSLVGKLVK
jgi:thiol-disulfide isomerase/thioredoxin